MTEKKPAAIFFNLKPGTVFKGLHIKNSKTSGFETYIDATNANLQDVYISDSDIRVTGTAINLSNGKNLNISDTTIVGPEQLVQLKTLTDDAVSSKTPQAFDSLKEFAMTLFQPSEVLALMQVVRAMVP